MKKVKAHLFSHAFPTAARFSAAPFVFRLQEAGKGLRKGSKALSSRGNAFSIKEFGSRGPGLFPIMAGFGLIAVALFGLIVIRNATFSSMALARADLSRAEILLNKGFPYLVPDEGANSLVDASRGLALFDGARGAVAAVRRSIQSTIRFVPLDSEDIFRRLAELDASIAAYRAAAAGGTEPWPLRLTRLKRGFEAADALMAACSSALVELERGLRDTSNVELSVGYAGALVLFLLLSFLALRYEKYGLRALGALRSSEASLQREKEELRVTLRSIGDAVISTDKEGRIALMNPEAERLCGWGLAEAAGRMLREVFPIFDAVTGEARKDPVERVLEKGRTVELADHTVLVPRNGSRRSIADSGAPIRDFEGNITGVVLVFRDVTEKEKDAEARERGQRLESLGFLAGGIAHDFNNLLAGIFGYIEIADAKARSRDAEGARASLAKASSAFERARDLTRQLLTFSCGGAPLLAPRDPGPIIRSAAEFALSGSRVALSVEIPDGLPVCECDENQIGQVVGNIVLNAAQAMGGTGRVSVRARAVSGPAEPAPGAQAGAPAALKWYVEAEFEDSGPGIPPEAMAKIFDPFFSTKQSGHGLGLATAYSIMKRHGGSVSAGRASGGGALFTIRLPASDGRGKRRESPARPRSGEGRAGIRSMLIMDDEGFVREILHEMLAGEGIAVTLAASGEEALALSENAKAEGKPFDACLLDLTVPGGKGGGDILGRIRQMGPETVVLSMSGYSSEVGGGAESGLERSGFDGHVLKPFRKSDVLSAVRAALSSRPGRKGS
jgi:PAS domain S-box-containing protein